MENENQCPNGCGEFETAYGKIDSMEGDTYFNVTVTYCPRCKYIESYDVNL